MVGMAFDRAASVISCALLLSLEFLMVTSQSPTASPVPSSPAQPPVVATPPSPISLPEAPAPAPESQSDPQVVQMIEAIRDAGQFGAISGLLDGLQMKNLTPMTTWLVPNDAAFSSASYPKNVTRFIDYHVLRGLLTFSRLATFTEGTRLTTFLDSETVVVTSNTRSNYSVDNGMIIVPDLYSDSTVAVHGINAVLNDALFNEGVAVPPSEESPTGVPGISPTSPSSRSPPSPSTSDPNPITLPNTAHAVPVSMALSLVLVVVVVAGIL